MLSQGLNRRQLVSGVCGAALALALQPAEAANVLNVTVGFVGQVVKAVGKPIKVSVAIAINAGNFVWSGAVGVFSVLIGQTKTFVRNIAGNAIKVVIEARTSFVRVLTSVSGVFGNASRAVIKNV